jgi:hypothetical protein
MGDTVLVGPGIYYENVDSLGNGIVLLSELGPESTIIDGSQAGSVISVTGSASIEGMTVRNGLSDDGGGIRAMGEAVVVTIRENIITDNRAGLEFDFGFGGGIAFQGQNATIESNRIENNYAGDSGGGIATGGPSIIRNNVVRGNGCHIGGGGILGEDQTEVVGNLIIENWSDSFGGGVSGNIAAVKSNTIVWNYIHNAAFPQAAGVDIDTSTPSVIQRNIIAFNHGPSGRTTGVGIKCYSSGSATIVCNDVWANDVDYELSGGCDTTGLGNISTNPQFCAPQAGDYGLSESSGCTEANSTCGLIGAFDIACGPVWINRLTWGRIKSLFLETKRHGR